MPLLPLPCANFSIQLLTAITLPAILSTSNKSVDTAPPHFLKCCFTPISNIQRLERTLCIGQQPQQQFVQYKKVIDWKPHGILKESETNTTSLPSQKANHSIVWHDNMMAGPLIQYYLDNQSPVHKHLWKVVTCFWQ